MKKLLVLLSIVTLLWTSPAVAEMKSLSDDQMDYLTAGATPRSRNASFSTSQQFDGSVDNTLNAQGLEALNVVNTPATTGNSSENNSSTNVTQVGGRAQQEARAVSIVNGTNNQVNAGFNVFAQIERSPGVTSSDLSGTSGLRPTSALPYINQSNIIVPH
jgi:hypothetical protein